MARHIVIPERLLEPVNVQIFRRRAETLACGQIPLAVAVNGDADGRTDTLTDGGEAGNIDIRIVMPDLDLQPGKPILLHRSRATRQQILQREGKPANIGIIGFHGRRARAAEIVPERHARLFRLQVPERNVNCGQRQMGDARPADPLQRRITGQFRPQPRLLRRILPHQQGRVTIADAGCDQPVRRQMRVGAGKTIALKAIAGGDLCTDDAPMGDAVGGIGNGFRCQRQVQDERFDGGNFHDRSFLDC